MTWLYILAAAVAGVLITWLIMARMLKDLASREAAAQANFRKAIVDLEAADRAREENAIALAGLRAERDAVAAGHAAQISALMDAKDALAGKFNEVASQLLERAQTQFLDAASGRFKQAEQENSHRLSQLLQPVNDRLQRYETAVEKVEADRKEAYGNLSALMEDMRRGQDAVRDSAANLMNSLRNAPKARGRWGEQQLRNVLESCGLSAYVDFTMEDSFERDGARLRPDVTLRVPGGRTLVIDAKVSLNDYQDAYNAVAEEDRVRLLARHGAAMKAHINSLGAKSYQDQFDDAPDFVIMFVPGEHFVAAALEQDPGLWDYAFGKRVLLATPTNLVAIARTVASVWRQEKMADQAREIGALGKELYARLATMGGHIAKLGKNLETSVGAYNQFVGSLETQVLTQARRFEALDVDVGGKQIEPLPIVEGAVRPQAKLVAVAPSTGPANDPAVGQGAASE